MNEPVPSVGDIVHFVLHEGPCMGEHRPAMVVRVTGRVLNLQIFSDGNQTKGDCLPRNFWRHNIAEDPEGKTPGTWHTHRKL